MKRYARLGVLAMVLGSCGCPPDVQIGSVTLQSRSFWPYAENDVLVFENSIGDTLALVTERFSNRGSQLEQELLCSKALIDQQWTYYQSVIGYTQSFKPLNTDHFLGLKVNLDVQNFPSDSTARDTIFYEALTINASVRNAVPNSSYFSFFTSTRGNDSTRFRNYSRFIPRIISDTIFGERRYRNVYTQPGIASLFFTKEEGIVAVRTAERTWTLKRIIR